MERQWSDIVDHCTDSPGAEHKLLDIMFRQIICAIDDCRHHVISHSKQRRGYRIRTLFRHEKVAHGTTNMSEICSFVRLSREGRIRQGFKNGSVPHPNCERFAFERMLEKVQALPAAELGLLFEKGGFPPGEHTPENLGRILTHDHLAQEGDDPPYWWPVPAENFLWFCRPQDPLPTETHRDHYWRFFWEDLRAMYADGRI